MEWLLAHVDVTPPATPPRQTSGDVMRCIGDDEQQRASIAASLPATRAAVVRRLASPAHSPAASSSSSSSAFDLQATVGLRRADAFAFAQRLVSLGVVRVQIRLFFVVRSQYRIDSDC